MGKRTSLVLLGAVLGSMVARADTTGITPTKLILIDKIGSAGKAKGVFVAKAPEVHKGPGTEVSALSARLDVAWPSTSGAFILPAGENDGTKGWLVNGASVAKYVSKSADLGAGDTVKVAVVKPGKLVKVVTKGLGDGPTIDLFDEPDGPVSACFSITNGIEQHRFGSVWGTGACSYKVIGGGNGRKVVCKGGAAPDPTCGASPAGCVNTLEPEPVAPMFLSETGLYADIESKTVAGHAAHFAPKYPLWSDGAEKERWAYLPECAQIDSSNMDDWDFPVGTRMWKEFSIAGVRLETRLVHRFGPGADDFLYATYAWNADETEATLVTTGVEDAKGTEHDIPAAPLCKNCHGSVPGTGGTPSRFLGFSAIQLSHAGPGVTMATLSADGALTTPAPGGFPVPGTPLEQDALGYLHANCANCHNATPSGVAFLGMSMRVSTTDVAVGTTGVYTDVVNQPVTFFTTAACTHRIAGGDVADSCVHFRMSERGDDVTPNPNQMPPLATDFVDAAGLATIEAWLLTLPSP